MYLKELETKRNNLENVKTKVNNDKNILLINIMKMSKKMAFYIQNAMLNRDLITSLNQKYDLDSSLIELENPFLQKEKAHKFRNIFIKEKQLWIYVTEVQKYSTDSYTRYENKILKLTKKVKQLAIKL